MPDPCPVCGGPGTHPLRSADCLAHIQSRHGAYTWTVPAERPQPVTNPLSPREFEVLQLLAQGLSFKQIANRWVTTTTTATKHAALMRRRLGVATNCHAVAIGVRNGWL